MATLRDNYFLLIFSSVVLIIAAAALRYVLISRIREGTTVLSDDQKRWIVRVKTTSVLAVVVGLIFIWLSQLHTFALSIAAFAVALVIATKELILCLGGAIYRATVQAFDVGDWIDIDGQRGEVTDQNVLAVKLEEIDAQYAFTGQTIWLPNSLFLSHVVRNLNYYKRYVIHSFSIITEPVFNPFDAQKMLLDQINALTAESREMALKHLERATHKAGVDLVRPDPQISISTTDTGKHNLTVSFLCPTDRAGSLEQEIKKVFMAYFYSRGKKQVAEDPK